MIYNPASGRLTCSRGSVRIHQSTWPSEPRRSVMRKYNPILATLAGLFIYAGVSAQTKQAEPAPLPAAPPSQLMAGLRGYPDELVNALLTLADQPQALQRLAEKPDLFERPESIQPELSSDQREAV